jgi:hypothetical protein
LLHRRASLPSRALHHLNIDIAHTLLAACVLTQLAQSAVFINGGGLSFVNGSVLNLNVPLTINNCTAATGGGIFATTGPGAPTFSPKIFANSALTLLDNTATSRGPPIAGGGLYLANTQATFSAKVTFERNVASRGFGGAMFAGTVLMTTPST